MADQSDVESALVDLAASALYPKGTEAVSVPGPDCRIYRGWPNSAALDSDLAAGRINVTVAPSNGLGRTTTRYVEQWMGTPAPPSLTVEVVGDSVTFGGVATSGQLAGLLVSGRSYVYRTMGSDTPELVAANLASLVRVESPVRLAASRLTIPGARDLLARVVADAYVQQEIRRQIQSFRTICWCPTPAIRDATAATIDLFLSGMQFIALPDNTQGRLVYAGTEVFDQSQNARLYRRDLLYTVEYASMHTATQPTMLFGDLSLNATRLTL